MRKRNNITVLSTFAGDTLVGIDGSIIRRQNGGPALYLKRALENERALFTLKTGKKIEVQILLTNNGEFGKVPKNPRPRNVTFSKITTPYLIISTVLDEFDLNNLSTYRGQVFMDIQGYVRNGDDFGKKKLWQSSDETNAKIFCLKGTAEEVQYLPKKVKQTQKKKVLIITKGRRGCEVFALGKRYIVIPPQVVTGVDTIGAGDTFFAYFILCYINTTNARESAKYAVQKTMAFLASRKA